MPEAAARRAVSRTPRPKLSADDTATWAAFTAEFEATPDRTTSHQPVVEEELPPVEPRRDRTDYDRRVDLHGLTRRRAAELLDRRLLEARLLGLEDLLVITGRGLHSASGPVLRLWLPEWAKRQADGAPLRCIEAPGEIGGAGAWIVSVARRSG